MTIIPLILSFRFLQNLGLAAVQQYTQCFVGYYCDGDVEAIRGAIYTADECYTACLAFGIIQGKDYKFFDLTTEGVYGCWCGETCNSREAYDTVAYALGNNACISPPPTLSHQNVSSYGTTNRTTNYSNSNIRTNS